MNNVFAAVHYVPLLTTAIAAVFSYSILRRYFQSPQKSHLFWWGLGVAVYGMGTVTESLYTLLGYSEFIFKAWYISGALLGGAPLAVGTAYLLFSRRSGNISASALAAIVTVTSLFVIFSPIKTAMVTGGAPNGSFLEWQSIRLVSPFVNSWAAIVLIGGAFYSAWQYRKNPVTKSRFIGNLYIAVGAILPGVGGGLSRAGYTEALYIGEFVGIIMIWTGYLYCRRPAVTKVIDPERLESIPTVEEVKE